jgi:hypothetical protein
MSKPTSRPLPRPASAAPRPAVSGMDVTVAATLDATAVLAALDTGPNGLAPAEVIRRRTECGPNAVRTHHARALGVLATSCAARCWYCC